MSKPSAIRALIIDDDQDDFIILSDYLGMIESMDFELEWCYDYDQAISHIALREFDIYFVDYRLGAKTGLDFLRDAMSLNCEEPMVLLTGKGNPAVDQEATRIGAMDYLIKSELNSEKLERCVRYALERASSLKAVRANEKKYRSIFERSKDAIFITDTGLRFRDINPATVELLGYSKQELLSLSLYDLIDDPSARQKIESGLRNFSQVVDIELTLKDKFGENKNAVLSASEQDEMDHVQYVQGILHDITNLKKAERATLHAEKLAAAGRLVRTLAHEVRNPLNNIQMAVEQLGALEEVSADDRVFLEIIQRNSKRIDKLIAELLDSYRPNQKVFKGVDLKHVLNESIQIASDRMHMKGISVDVNYAADNVILLADEEKLKIAFLNILVNAAEAIPEKGGIIQVSLATKQQMVSVEIKDNGSGIPPEIQSKLFEPYFTSKRNGMGLGLPSTLNIIQMHGGNIDVQSVLGAGSTFTISFPIQNEHVMLGE